MLISLLTADIRYKQGANGVNTYCYGITSPKRRLEFLTVAELNTKGHDPVPLKSMGVFPIGFKGKLCHPLKSKRSACD